MKYKKIKRYHKLRKILLREILKIFMSETLFARLYNIKKYMIMYSIIAHEMIEEAYDMLSAEKKIAG